jgi:hypothetical protein
MKCDVTLNEVKGAMAAMVPFATLRVTRETAVRYLLPAA